MDTAIVVFTRDLRLHDNPALHQACARARQVVPLFVLDPAIADPKRKNISLDPNGGALHGVLGERHAVTPEMAARLGRLLGKDPMLWLRMQQARDLWRIQHDKAAALATHRDV